MHPNLQRASRILLVTFISVATGSACSDSETVAAPQLSVVTGVVASVHGSGHIRRPDGSSRIFALTAVRHADGTVSGNYTLESTGPDSPIRVRGNITCLVVDGASAYIGGDVTRFDANPFDPFPQGVAIEIIDNGQGSGAAPDLLSPAFFTMTQQEVLDYCADPAPGPVFEIERGNFQVR